jgi:prepilin-type N-terminal cleavage/methylation domain-containing protein
MKTIPLIKQAGFTMVETTIVIVVLGVFSVFAVPRYSYNIERGKASEAFTYLAQVESAQERFHAKNGSYCQRINGLDVGIGKPRHFRPSPVTSMDWRSRWQMRLTRLGQGSGYGEYTVVFDQDGFSEIKSSVPFSLQP